MNEIKKAYLKLTLVKSTIGINPKHKLCVRALGLRKVNSSAKVLSNPLTKGLINKISYLLKVQELS